LPIQPDRFHPHSWWTEIAETRATIVHYLVDRTPSARQPPGKDERVTASASASVRDRAAAASAVRGALRLPADRALGMTEMVRVLADTSSRARWAPVHSGARLRHRCAHRRRGGHDVADGQPGEMLVRHSWQPHGGLLLGLSQGRGGNGGDMARWLVHTGDVVWRGPDGMLHFVDRKKTIIRRSGENIAAPKSSDAAHPPRRATSAVMAVKDELREEEVRPASC